MPKIVGREFPSATSRSSLLYARRLRALRRIWVAVASVKITARAPAGYCLMWSVSSSRTASGTGIVQHSTRSCTARAPVSAERNVQLWPTTWSPERTAGRPGTSGPARATADRPRLTPTERGSQRCRSPGRAVCPGFTKDGRVMRRVVIGAAIAAGTLLAMGAPSAFVGEITGNGKGTPLISHGPAAPTENVGHFEVIASCCSFFGTERR